MASVPSAVSQPSFTTLARPLTPYMMIDYESVRRKVTACFSVFSLTCAYSLVQGLRKPLGIFSILRIGAPLVGTLGCLMIAWSFFKPTFRNPEGALLLLKKAGKYIHSPQFTFAGLERQYRDLFRWDILTSAHINPFLSQDIYALDFDAFIAKHVGKDDSCKMFLFNLLSSDNRQVLYGKFLQKRIAQPSYQPDTAEKTLETASQTLNSKILSTPNLNTFLDLRGLPPGFERYYMQLPNMETDQINAEGEAALRILLLQGLSEDMEYRRYLEYITQFRPETYASLRASLAPIALEQYIEKQTHNFHGIYGVAFHHTWEDFAATLQIMDQQDPAKSALIKEKLGKLSTQYHLFGYDMLKPESEHIRATLGLTLDMMASYLREQCDQLDYCGGFHHYHGSCALLPQGMLTSEQLEKIKNELRAKIPSMPPECIPDYLKDLQFFGIAKEVLLPRWEKIKIAGILNHPTEKKLALATIEQGVFTKEEWEQRAQDEIQSLSLSEILERYYHLFTTFISPAQIWKEGKTFAEHADAQADLTTYLPTMLQEGLLTANSPSLLEKFKAFYHKYGRLIFESVLTEPMPTPEVNRACSIRSFPTYEKPLISAESYNHIRQALTAARTSWWEKTKQSTEASIEESFRLKRQEYENKLARQQQDWNKEKEELRESSYKIQKPLGQLENQLHTTQTTLETHQKQLQNLKTKLAKIPELKERITAQITSLEQLSPPTEDPTAITRQVVQADNEWRKKAQADDEAVSNDPHYLQLKRELVECTAQLEQNRFDPQLEKAVEKKNAEIAQYTHRPATEQAKAELSRLQKAQYHLIMNLEMEANKTALITQFKSKVAEIYRGEQEGPAALTALQEEIATHQQTSDELQTKIRELKAQIQPLESGVAQLNQLERQSGQEKEAFFARLEKEKKLALEKVEADYKQEVDQIIEEFAKKCVADLQAAAQVQVSA